MLLPELEPENLNLRIEMEKIMKPSNEPVFSDKQYYTPNMQQRSNSYSTSKSALS